MPCLVIHVASVVSAAIALSSNLPSISFGVGRSTAAPSQSAVGQAASASGVPFFARRVSGSAIDSDNGGVFSHAYLLAIHNTMPGDLRITGGNTLAAWGRQVRRPAGVGGQKAARPGERFAHLMSTGFDAAIDAPRALDAESIGMAARPPMEMNCARTTDGNPESGPGESGEV